jgi:hypothetical protein
MYAMPFAQHIGEGCTCRGEGMGESALRYISGSRRPHWANRSS